ncbi:MAG: NUDIX domain-containing protein [Bacteroidota bacterium]
MTQTEHLNKLQVTKNSFECSVTTDIAVFGYLDGELKIMLCKRQVGTSRKNWLLPGGALKKDETLEGSAIKVLNILTGIKDVYFEQVKVYSKLDRHPIKRVLTVCFYALVNPEKHPLVLGETVEGIKWFAIDQLPSSIGFDHRELIMDSILYLRNNIKTQLMAEELLPSKFTLQELQIVYENILGSKLDRRNFRKRMLQLDIFENTGQKKLGIKGGPYFYSLK